MTDFTDAHGWDVMENMTAIFPALLNYIVAGQRAHAELADVANVTASLAKLDARGGRAELRRLSLPLSGHDRWTIMRDFAALIFIFLAITVIATITIFFLAGTLTST